jgi:glycerophosphoryl diester phosphodiesterase
MVDVGPLAPQEPKAFLVTSHRGSLHTGALPDNSIPALREAAAAGVELLEVDVRRSVEGELFLFHDGSIQSANSYPPRALRGMSIQKLTREEREQVYLDANRTIHVPMLDDALTFIAHTKSSLQLDFKGESDQLVFQALDLVERRGLLPKVVLQIRNSARIEPVKKRYPGVRIIARCRSMEQLQTALVYGVEFVELERWISSEAIGLAHSRGALVLINIASTRLDEVSTWEYLRSRGVDVIMSNFGDKHRPTVRSDF